MTNDKDSAVLDIVERLDLATSRLGSESKDEATARRNKTIADAKAEILRLRQPTQSDPEAMRYGFDGFGYKYIDSGSGSDWRTRHPDAEPLYASQPTQSDALTIAREALEGMVNYSGMRESWQDNNPQYVEAARDAIDVIDAALQGQSK